METVVLAAWAAASMFVLWMMLATMYVRRRDRAWQERLQAQAEAAQPPELPHPM